METLAQRLTLARKRRGLTQAALAEMSGLKQPDISKIELGTIAQTTGIARLARALRVPAEWLEQGVGPEPDWNARPTALVLVAEDAPNERDGPATGYVRLPVLAEAAAGPGRAVLHDPELVQHIDVLETWVRQTLRANPNTVKVLTARGHSMAGVVEDGDVLFVELCTSFDVDGLYVLSVDDLVRIKRLRLRLSDGQLSIESNDGSVPEIVRLAELGNRIHVHGRVIAAWTLKRL